MAIENGGIPGDKPQGASTESDLLELLHRELVAIVLTDREKLGKELSWQARQFDLKFSREGHPPAHPFENPLVALGYAKALHDLAQEASRFIIPGNTIVFLLQNQEAYQALKLLSDQPIGNMVREDYLQQAAPDPVVSLQALTSLEERRLAADERRGGNKPQYVVRITSSGQAAAGFIELHQKDAKPTAQPTNPDKDLQPNLGNEIKMLISNESEVSLADQAEEGSKVTIGETIYRLGLARAVARRMTTLAEGRQPYDIATVRAWFLGMDPLLDDHSPALEIAKMEPGDIKGITRILRAADAFLAE